MNLLICQTTRNHHEKVGVNEQRGTGEGETERHACAKNVERFDQRSRFADGTARKKAESAWRLMRNSRSSRERKARSGK